MAGAAMAKKRMGRPKGNRDDVSIKFDRVLANRARQVALNRGLTVAQYLSELSRKQINADYAEVLRDVEGKA